MGFTRENKEFTMSAKNNSFSCCNSYRKHFLVPCLVLCFVTKKEAKLKWREWKKGHKILFSWESLLYRDREHFQQNFPGGEFLAILSIRLWNSDLVLFHILPADPTGILSIRKQFPPTDSKKGEPSIIYVCHSPIQKWPFLNGVWWIG